MKLYVDTSAFVKLVLDEEGSDVIASLWADPIRLTSVITYVEARAAIASAVRAGRVAARDSSTIRAGLEGRWGEVYAVDVDGPLSTEAGGVAEERSLAGADAIHLTTAVALAGRDLVFACWDSRLAAAARDAGLAVVP